MNSNQNAANNPLFAMGIGSSIVGGVWYAQRTEEPGPRPPKIRERQVEKEMIEAAARKLKA